MELQEPMDFFFPPEATEPIEFFFPSEPTEFFPPSLTKFELDPFFNLLTAQRESPDTAISRAAAI